MKSTMLAFAFFDLTIPALAQALDGTSSPANVALLLPGVVEPIAAVAAPDDQPISIMLDFVDPIGADRRFSSFNRLSGDDEPGRKRLHPLSVQYRPRAM
jgi:hypothetical protein